MVRKATLGKSAAQELRAKIDCALLPETRRRLGGPATDFLISIRGQITASVVRLSKKQRDVTEEILAKAFSGESVVVLEGQALVDLARLIDTRGDPRNSAREEYALLRLRDRPDGLAATDSGERTMAISPKQWGIFEEI